MVKMIVLYAGILAVLIAVPRWARSLPDARRGRIVVGLAVSSATLVIGTLGRVATRRLGRWLMIASLVVPLTVGSLSWGFAGLVPAVIVAVAATRLAFTRPTQHPAATS